MISNFLIDYFKGVSKGLLLAYLFISPLFIYDEFNRLNQGLIIGKVFLPIYSFVRAFFGILLLFFKQTHKDITKLYLTLEIFYGIILFFDIKQTIKFEDLYDKNSYKKNQKKKL